MGTVYPAKTWFVSRLWSSYVVFYEGTYCRISFFRPFDIEMDYHFNSVYNENSWLHRLLNTLSWFSKLITEYASQVLPIMSPTKSPTNLFICLPSIASLCYRVATQVLTVKHSFYSKTEFTNVMNFTEIKEKCIIFNRLFCISTQFPGLHDKDVE